MLLAQLYSYIDGIRSIYRGNPDKWRTYKTRAKKKGKSRLKRKELPGYIQKSLSTSYKMPLEFSSCNIDSPGLSARDYTRIPKADKNSQNLDAGAEKSLYQLFQKLYGKF